MNWAEGIKVATLVMGASLALTAVVVWLIFAIGGWALIPILVAMFAAIAVVEAAR